MFSFLSGWSFWLWLVIAASALGGTYLLGREAGREKEIKRMEAYLTTQLDAQAKALKAEYDAQAELNREVETIIEERVIERDRWRTRVEQVIVDNPSPIECRMPQRVFDEINRAIDEINTPLQPGG